MAHSCLVIQHSRPDTYLHIKLPKREPNCPQVTALTNLRDNSMEVSVLTSCSMSLSIET